MANKNIVLQVPYVVKKWVPVLCILFFGTCAIFLEHMSVTNDKGLIINRIIHLDVNEASTLLLILSVVSAAFSILGIFILFSKDKTITFTDKELLTPKSAIGKMVTIQLADIHAIYRTHAGGQDFITIEYTDKKVQIPLKTLKHREQLEELELKLIERLEDLNLLESE